VKSSRVVVITGAHAVQGFCDSLRSELIHDGSNVRLTMIDIAGAAAIALSLPRGPVREHYSNWDRLIV